MSDKSLAIKQFHLAKRDFVTVICLMVLDKRSNKQTFSYHVPTKRSVLLVSPYRVTGRGLYVCAVPSVRLSRSLSSH